MTYIFKHDGLYTIDYTIMRIGTVTRRAPDGSAMEKIARCPKCGQRGSFYPEHFISVYAIGKHGAWIPSGLMSGYITHTASMFGPLMSVQDHCNLDMLPFSRIISAGLQRSAKSRYFAKDDITDSDWPALPYIPEVKW